VGTATANDVMVTVRMKTHKSTQFPRIPALPVIVMLAALVDVVSARLFAETMTTKGTDVKPSPAGPIK